MAGLLATLCLVANYSYAQEKQQSTSEETKKKVIVKKITTDGNDKEIKVIVNTGDADVEIEQNVQVDVEEINGEKHIKVEVHPMNGEAEIIEWNGEGDLPEEVREQLESKGVFLHELDDEAKKGVFIYKDGGNHSTFNWVSDDTPGAFLGVMSAHEAKVTVIVDEDGEEKITETPASDEDGLVIGEVVTGSAAEAAGLMKGDILRRIDGNNLDNFSDLVEFMQTTEVGQKIAIAYERNGELLETEATLQARKAEQGNVIIERIIDDEDLDHQSDNVFIFRTDEDGEEVKIHKKHRIVVITRGDKEEAEKEEGSFTTELLPDNELQRTLNLRDYSLFPNPTDGNLRLRFVGEASPTKIEINDLSGKNVYREQLNRFDGQYDEQIDLSDLPSGIFLLTIEQNDKVYTEQIVVK